MMNDDLNNEYFEWMCNIVCGDRFSENISHTKLLTYLHNREFIYSMPRDANRLYDGISLRYRFSIINHYKDLSDYLEGPCSVLEMMVALAIHCEEIMDDPKIGDRTGQWFWGMIRSLGLGSMTDDRFDMEYVESVIDRFLDREYEPNGKGGLFTIKNCERDLRNVEIQYQMYWYLDNIV